MERSKKGKREALAQKERDRRFLGAPKGSTRSHVVCGSSSTIVASPWMEQRAVMPSQATGSVMERATRG
jgi:hypothetical protein